MYTESQKIQCTLNLRRFNVHCSEDSMYTEFQKINDSMLNLRRFNVNQKEILCIESKRVSRCIESKKIQCESKKIQVQ